MKTLYLIIAFAPLLAAIVAGLFGRSIGRVGAHSVTIFAVLLSFLCSCVVFWDVLQGGSFNGPVYTWLTSGGTRFEIAAVVLLVAIIAAIALTLRRRKDTKAYRAGEQLRARREERVRLVAMPVEKE